MNIPASSPVVTPSAELRAIIESSASTTKVVKRFFYAPILAFIDIEAAHLDAGCPEAENTTTGGSKTRLCRTLARICQDLETAFPGENFSAPAYVLGVATRILGKSFGACGMVKYCQLLWNVQVADIVSERTRTDVDEALAELPN